MVEAETRRSVSGRRPAAIKRAAAVGLVVAAVVCVCASLSTGGQGWGSVELEREPKEVRQLEREASHVRCKRGLRAFSPLPGDTLCLVRGNNLPGCARGKSKQERRERLPYTASEYERERETDREREGTRCQENTSAVQLDSSSQRTTQLSETLLHSFQIGSGSSFPKLSGIHSTQRPFPWPKETSPSLRAREENHLAMTAPIGSTVLSVLAL